MLAFSVALGAAAAMRVPGMKTLSMDIAGVENLLAASAARMASMTVVGVVVPLSIGPSWTPWASAGRMRSLRRGTSPACADEPCAASTGNRDTGAAFCLRRTQVWHRILPASPSGTHDLGVMVLTEMFGWSVEPILPVVVRDVLGGGATGLGMLFAAASGGAAISALVLSSVRVVPHKGWLMVVGIVGFGCFLFCFALLEIYAAVPDAVPSGGSLDLLVRDRR